MLKRQCQPSAQVLDRIPTTGAKDAKMQKDPNVSPQASQTPSAKTRVTRKSRERQPMKRCQMWWWLESEQCGSTRCVDQSICAYTGLESRRARRPRGTKPGQKKDSCKSGGTQEIPHKKTSSQNSNAWGRPRAGQTERKSSEHVKGSSVRQ